MNTNKFAAKCVKWINNEYRFSVWKNNVVFYSFSAKVSEDEVERVATFTNRLHTLDDNEYRVIISEMDEEGAGLLELLIQSIDELIEFEIVNGKIVVL